MFTIFTNSVANSENQKVYKFDFFEKNKLKVSNFSLVKLFIFKMDWLEGGCLDISDSEVDPEVLTRNFDEEPSFEHEFDIDKCFEIALNRSDSNNLFEMVDKADQAMELEKALKNNEEINVESLVESDGETKLQHGMFNVVEYHKKGLKLTTCM